MAFGTFSAQVSPHGEVIVVLGTHPRPGYHVKCVGSYAACLQWRRKQRTQARANPLLKGEWGYYTLHYPDKDVEIRAKYVGPAGSRGSSLVFHDFELDAASAAQFRRKGQIRARDAIFTMPEPNRLRVYNLRYISPSQTRKSQSIHIVYQDVPQNYPSLASLVERVRRSWPTHAVLVSRDDMGVPSQSRMTPDLDFIPFKAALVFREEGKQVAIVQLTPTLVSSTGILRTLIRPTSRWDSPVMQAILVRAARYVMKDGKVRPHLAKYFDPSPHPSAVETRSMTSAGEAIAMALEEALRQGTVPGWVSDIAMEKNSAPKRYQIERAAADVKRGVLSSDVNVVLEFYLKCLPSIHEARLATTAAMPRLTPERDADTRHLEVFSDYLSELTAFGLVASESADPAAAVWQESIPADVQTPARAIMAKLLKLRYRPPYDQEKFYAEGARYGFPREYLSQVFPLGADLVQDAPRLKPVMRNFFSDLVKVLERGELQPALASPTSASPTIDAVLDWDDE